jgi:ribosomal protein S6
MSNIKEKDPSVYEIGYLIASSIPEEKIPETADAVKKVIIDAGATIIAEEQPVRQPLAYTIRRKTVSGAYDKYDMAYFGWTKFELGSDAIESVKKSIEIQPAVLRMLLISTTRENTYLGKRAIAAMAKADAIVTDKVEDKKDVAPATVEEMDKSIDDMVKEA